MSKKNNTTMIIALALVMLVAVAFAYQQGYLSNIALPSGFGGASGENNGSQGGDTYNYYDDNDDTPPAPANNRQPTSLTCAVSPNPVTMKGWVHGSVTSNGYNWPVTVYARLKGIDQTQSFDAFLGSDGMYTLEQQLNIAGYWEFWAKTSEGATSNTVSLTCIGILISPSSSFYSRLVAHPITFKIFSNYDGTATLTATSPLGVTTTLGTVSVSHLGYGEGTFNMPTATLGNYHVDCTLAGHTASSYSGDVYVEVTR